MLPAAQALARGAQNAQIRMPPVVISPERGPHNQALLRAWAMSRADHRKRR